VRPVELMIWSAEVGSIGLIVLLALADAVYSRSRASVHGLVYLFSAWLFVTLLSGLPAALFAGLSPDMMQTAQILIGPWCAGIGSYGASLWLGAHQRDRTMKVSLRTATAVCLAGGPLCFLLAPELRLPASAALSVTGVCVSLWLGVRAAQLGDRMAWGLAAGALLTLPLQVGMYWLLIGNRPPALWQMGMAIAGLSSVTVTATMIWLRNRHEQRIRSDGQSRRDPITQLYSSVVMLQKIIRAQHRRMRTRRDGALMAVMLFAPEQLFAQVGQYGLNEIYIQLARRMQRHTGVVNPAGRYYDRCFVVLIETMHSPRWIRILSLRVASSLRQPIDVTSLAGERIRIHADIGVGVVHLSGVNKDVDQLLHEVQSVTEAARSMRSRAALLDPDTHHAVPVESAELGTSWRALRAASPASRYPKSSGKPSKSSRSSRPPLTSKAGRLSASVRPGHAPPAFRPTRQRKPA
jgi:GGDEF domain-containing protein